MKDNENISVEDFLREADEMLNRINSRINRREEDEEIKTYVPSKTDKAVTDDDCEEETKTYTSPKINSNTMVNDKTRQIPVSDKTKQIPVTDKTIVRKPFSENDADTDEYETRHERHSFSNVSDRPITIRTKSGVDKSADLREVPTIFAVDELEKAGYSFKYEAHSSEGVEKNDNEYDMSDQIKISGFDDEVDEIPSIDEELAEEQLRQRREDKVNKFRLFAKEEISDNENNANDIVSSSISDNSNRTKAVEAFFKNKAQIQLQAVVTLLFSIVLLLLSVFENSTKLPSFLSTDKAYFITTLIIYGLVLIVNVKTLLHAFNFKKGLNFDFAITLSALFTLVHTAMLLLVPDMALISSSVYPAVSSLAMFFSAIGKHSVLQRIINDYEFLTDGKEKYTVEDIVNEVDATIISRNLLSGEPLLKYSVKTDNPTSFIDISCAYEPADRIAKIITPITVLLSGVLFAIVGVLQKDWYYAFNVLVAGIIITCPVVALLSANVSLLGVSQVLTKKGAIVNGFEGARVTHHSNAIVMEASNLFGEHSCELYGVRLFNKAKIDDSLLLAAAVIMKTKSPLRHVFDSVIVGKQTILPYVDTVIYEEKMGTSAWVYENKVLVGNRDLLIRHGISVPKEEYEKKYASNGKKALYLAVSGKISAMFIVSYSADTALKKELKRLEKSGITILLKSCDPYINDESVMEIFGVPEGFIRVMTSSNARVFEKYCDTVVEKSPAYTVHNGTALGFISAVRASENLISTEGILSVLTIFGSIMGFGVVALLGLLDGLNQLTALNVIIFQCIWSIFVLIVSKIRRSGV